VCAYRVTKYIISLVLSCSTNDGFLDQRTRVITGRLYAILAMQLCMRLPWNPAAGLSLSCMFFTAGTDALGCILLEKPYHRP